MYEGPEAADISRHRTSTSLCTRPSCLPSSLDTALPFHLRGAKSPTMSALPSGVVELLERFEASKILLVEWEISLLQRLGYPLVSNGVSQSASPTRRHT